MRSPYVAETTTLVSTAPKVSSRTSLGTAVSSSMTRDAVAETFFALVSAFIMMGLEFC